jgi:hypothetical protein
MADAAPNWYRDPTGRNELRYWNGSQWTNHVANAGAQATDPLDAPGVAAVATTLTTITTAKPDQAVSEDPPAAEKKQGRFARMRQERRAKESGRDEFEAIALRAAIGEPDAVAALAGAVDSARSLYRSDVFEKKLWETMATAVRSVIDDDVLTREEEEHLHRLGDILGTPLQEMETRDRPLFEELAIAGINDGRLPHLDNPSIMLKRDENAYGSFAASLMKEQAVREYRAGTSSVSIPLGGGARYRVGGVRGRSVVVGSELVAQDSGVITVTNQRSVFTGRAKTLEFRHDRMVGLEQFTDGLRVNVSNRQTASLFRMQSPSLAAALIVAAVSRAT